MLILASQSPRRRELLGRITTDFIVRPTGADEHLCCDDPVEYVRQLALRKAQAGQKDPAFTPEDAILAADTIVCLDGRKLEKPADAQEAKAMLRALSGRTHTVCTGVAVHFRGETRSFVQQTQVEFYALEDSLIDAYVATGEPMDKAGAYGIQGRGSVLVKGIRGDYFNVVGLPVAETFRLLEAMHVLPEIGGAR